MPLAILGKDVVIPDFGTENGQKINLCCGLQKESSLTISLWRSTCTVFMLCLIPLQLIERVDVFKE